MKTVATMLASQNIKKQCGNHNATKSKNNTRTTALERSVFVKNMIFLFTRVKMCIHTPQVSVKRAKGISLLSLFLVVSHACHVANLLHAMWRTSYLFGCELFACRRDNYENGCLYIFYFYPVMYHEQKNLICGEVDCSTLSTLEKIQQTIIKYFHFIFVGKQVLAMETICMKCQILFSRQNKKTINVSSAELAQGGGIG